MVKIYKLSLKIVNMRILLISPYFYPEIGGAEFAAYEVCKLFAKSGHKVKVVTKHFGEFKEHEILDGVEIFRVRAKRIKGMQSLSAFPSMLKLAMKFSKESDIVHAYIPYPSTIIAYIIKKLRKKPYIVTSQGSELLDYPEERAIKLLKPIIGVCLRKAEYVHVISNALKRSIVENYGVKESRIMVIPNGVNFNLFNIKMRKKSRKRKVIVSVSRLTPKNGIEFLIRAMKIVLKEIDAELVIAGEGEQRRYLENLAEELGIKDKIVFLGWVKYENVPEILSKADVFVRPSITEGLGTAFLEAMACGVPVIATNVQGIVDIIKHDYNGLLVEPKNVERIAESIIKVLEDSELRERLIKNGLNFVERYKWSKIAKEYLEIYEKALSQSA